MRRLIAIVMCSAFFNSHAHVMFPSSWREAKNTLDDSVYKGHRKTIYCGCSYESDNDSDGSGDIDADACGLQGVSKMRNVRNTIQWEHIVPASLMPVGQFACWKQEQSISNCTNELGEVTLKNRSCCMEVSPSGKMMMLDLHNIAPAAAQLNQYRSNDYYGEVSDTSQYEGFGSSCEARDLGGTATNGLFEPPDCKKGDVARVWLYMWQTHGVHISPPQMEMFERWSLQDPVSPWEKKRSERIFEQQGNSNPYVDSQRPTPEGSCSWEQSITD